MSTTPSQLMSAATKHGGPDACQCLPTSTISLMSTSLLWSTSDRSATAVGTGVGVFVACATPTEPFTTTSPATIWGCPCGPSPATAASVNTIDVLPLPTAC